MSWHIEYGHKWRALNSTNESQKLLDFWMTIFLFIFVFLVKQLKDYQSFLRVFVQAIHYHSRRRDKPSCLCVHFDLKFFRKFNVFFDYSIFNYLLSLIRQWTRYFLVNSTCYWPLLNSNTGRVIIYLFRFAPNQWNELLSQKKRIHLFSG